MMEGGVHNIDFEEEEVHNHTWHLQRANSFSL